MRRRKSGNGCGGEGEFALAPLVEGPVPAEMNNNYNRQAEEEDDEKEGGKKSRYPRHDRHRQPSNSWLAMKTWMRTAAAGGNRSRRASDPRLLLGILGCPLAPVAVPCTSHPFPNFSIKGFNCNASNIETSSAQYIVQQYIAATGAAKAHASLHNSYAAGRVKMITTEYEGPSKVTAAGKRKYSAAEDGWFVLWQMMPDKWHMELALENSKIQAGCDGNLVWRYTPWLGAHAAKGPVRPLRRALQGLNPTTTASLFANAQCVGEKRIEDEDCFVLKVRADQPTLSSRSDGPAEIIRHVLLGYFSQKTGLLICLEDTHLTRIQSTDSGAVYWDTVIESTLRDYRAVDGVALAHSGHSAVTLFRFGEEAMSHTKTRIEEMWSIDEVAFNVPGLSPEFFIPPADVNPAANNTTSTKEVSDCSPLDQDIHV